MMAETGLEYFWESKYLLKLESIGKLFQIVEKP